MTAERLKHDVPHLQNDWQSVQ